MSRIWPLWCKMHCKTCFSGSTSVTMGSLHTKSCPSGSLDWWLILRISLRGVPSPRTDASGLHLLGFPNQSHTWLHEKPRQRLWGSFKSSSVPASVLPQKILKCLYAWCFVIELNCNTPFTKYTALKASRFSLAKLLCQLVMRNCCDSFSTFLTHFLVTHYPQLYFFFTSLFSALLFGSGCSPMPMCLHAHTQAEAGAYSLTSQFTPLPC